VQKKNMNITEDRISGVVIVHLQGRMDTAVVLTVERHVNELIDSGEKRIVLNMSKLDYMSSSGIRLLIGIAKRLDDENGGFALSTLPEMIIELLTMTKMNELIYIAENDGDAIRKLVQ
jgi:stage II sporulation protein AA (anti-sigma F factor antagonist)